MSTATATPSEQNASITSHLLDRRKWFAVTGLVLVLASLLPPLDMLARHHVWAESIQFLVLALVGPALIVLGAPWRFLRLSRGEGAGEAGLPAPADGPADRLAEQRRQQTSFLRAAIFLLAFMGVSLAWRLPPVMDALARQPALTALELVTLLPAGIALWLELLDSPPLAPRLPYPHRAAVAALSMWFIWTVAYALGFANHAVLHAYDAGQGLSVVADQEITAGLMWVVPGLCFIPVVIITMGRWLTRGDGPEEELQRVLRDEGNRAVVRGWDVPSRRRPTSST